MLTEAKKSVPFVNPLLDPERNLAFPKADQLH
jgi:hypothetical protein